MAGTNTTEIAHKIAKLYPELTNKQAEAIVKSTSEEIVLALTNLEPDSRDRISIRGLGNFGVKNTKERTVKNIKTGEPQVVPAGLRITFKAAQEAKDAVKTGDFEVKAYDTGSRKAAPKAAAAKTVDPTPAKEEVPDVDL